MAKITLTDLVSGFLSKAGLNNNFQKVEDELNNNVLYRDNPGSEPNQMEQFLDMNSNRIVNVGSPVAGTDALRLKDITDDDKSGTAASTSVEDTDDNFTSENVEGVLEELSNASTINTVDSGDFYVATDVEATLQEIGPHIQEVVADVATLQAASFETGIERIWLSGYYGLGTPGGGALYRDANDVSTADNGGTVFVDVDDIRWKRPDKGEWSAEQFGAVGDGVTDDADALQASATAAEGKSWVLESGTYITSKQISVPSCHVVCRANNCEVDGSSITSGDAPDNSILFFGGGDSTALPAINANVSASDVIIPFASAHGLSVGDYFVIFNPTDSSWSGFRTNYHAGEWCQVAEVVSTTSVRVNSPLFDSYDVADVDLYVVDMAQYSFSGKLSAVANSPSFAIRGLRFERVADTDISQLRSVVEDGHVAISTSQCVNITGTGLVARHYGDSGTGTDYGLSVGNSQHIHLEGFFSASRHGVTHGGGSGIGSVPVRDSVIRGTAQTHGDSSTTLAFDWHGNTEYCKFDGLALGGINPAGNHHTVRGTIIDNGTGILAYCSEWLGHDFDFSGVRFVSLNAVEATARGAFDIGGSQITIDENTMKGGVLNLSNTVWDLPNVTGSVFKWTNRGATPGQAMDVDLRGAKFNRLNSSATLINTSVDSGGALDFLGLEGMWSDESTSFSISGSSVDILRGPSEAGVEAITTDTGETAITTAITFNRAFPVTPSVVAVPNDPTTSADRLIAYARNVTTSGFDLELRTAGGGNFSAALSRDVSWQAATAR